MSKNIRISIRGVEKQPVKRKRFYTAPRLSDQSSARANEDIIIRVDEKKQRAYRIKVY